MTSSREDRFRELSAAVSGDLRRYVVRRVPADDVDDVLAEVTLVLWRRLEAVPPGEVVPWSYGVARNVIANHHRSGRRRLRLVDRIRMVDPPREVGPEGPEFPEVHAALARLGELDREVVRLWAWEQLAPSEIASVTGLTPNAVSVRLTKAKRRLAELLGGGKDPAGSGHVPDDRRSGR